MYVVKHSFVESVGNKRAEMTGGKITMEGSTLNGMLYRLESRRGDEVLSLRTGCLLLRQLKGAEGRGGGSWKGWKKRTDGLGRGRWRSGKSISDRVGKARCVLDSEGKFREEGQLPLLADRFGWGVTVEGRMTFKVRLEVEHS